MVQRDYSISSGTHFEYLEAQSWSLPQYLSGVGRIGGRRFGMVELPGGDGDRRVETS